MGLSFELVFLVLCSTGAKGFFFAARQGVRAPLMLHAAPSAEIIDRAVSVAEAAAREAGREIMAGMGCAVMKEKLNFKDIVTEVDGRCQSLIAASIREAFPSHSFLGEEDVPSGAKAATNAIREGLASSEWCWIVDPVDGTTNLAAGIPFVTTSIALARNGIVELGVVFDPSHEEMFVAKRGRGAYLNGEPISNQRVGDAGAPVLSDVVLCVGNPPLPSAFARNLRLLASLGPKVRGTRMLSSAALIMCWVGLGRVGAYVASDINAWDFAAGQLMVQECGGRTSDWAGNALALTHRATVCSAGGRLHYDILAELEAVLAREEAHGDVHPPP